MENVLKQLEADTTILKWKHTLLMILVNKKCLVFLFYDNHILLAYSQGL